MNGAYVGIIPPPIIKGVNCNISLLFGRKIWTNMKHLSNTLGIYSKCFAKLPVNSLFSRKDIMNTPQKRKGILQLFARIRSLTLEGVGLRTHTHFCASWFRFMITTALCFTMWVPPRLKPLILRMPLTYGFYFTLTSCHNLMTNYSRPYKTSKLLGLHAWIALEHVQWQPPFQGFSPF